MRLPAGLVQRTRDVFGRRGDAWLWERGLRGWGIAHAVLSACWSLEDHGSGWQGAIATAEAPMHLS